MKILFPLPTDNKRHRYCQNCNSENVHDETIEGKTFYKCENCGKTLERLLDIDPALSWWVDPKTHEYWHESVGVLVKNPEIRFLFLERTIYPYGFTIPSGHLEKGENPLVAAKRELSEETGLVAEDLVDFKRIEIPADSCRRGADSHKWNLFRYLLREVSEITSDTTEGKNPVWLTFNEALTRKLTPPVRYILENYGQALI